MKVFFKIFGAATDVLGITLGGVGIAIFGQRYFGFPLPLVVLFSFLGLGAGMWRFYRIAKSWEDPS